MSEPSKHIRTDRNAEDYDDKTDVQHVYDIPDTYIGSTYPKEREEYVLNFNETPMKLMKAKINLSYGVERLFLEILSNAGDNADFSRRAGVNPGSIDITMDKKWIKVRNGGAAIPVAEHPKHPGKYIPNIIFGKLRSSSNYDPTVVRMGCGRNGFGAKLTNIFSKAFIVTIGDPKNRKKYTGTWSENMAQGVDPDVKIEHYVSTEGFVEIAWHLDFDRFKLPEYPDEAFYLFARYAADFSLTCKIPVSFNGINMNFSNISDYAKLYWSEEECEDSVYHCEWPSASKEHPNGILPTGFKPATLMKQVSSALKAEHIPIVELIVLDTPDNGVCLSFVNGLMTIDGGVHTDAAYAAVASKIISIVNGTPIPNGKSKKKGSTGAGAKEVKKDKEIKMPKLTTEDVKRHISIIINCRIPDPIYSSQSKTKMDAPKPDIKVNMEELKNVEKWNLIRRLYAILEQKLFNELAKTNGKRSKHLALDAGEDANDAGTDKSSECILYLVEGKSASAYPKKRITMTSGGKDTSGWYPLRGKFMNVRNQSDLRIAHNKEVQAIKSMMGLREQVDYTKIEHLLTLRYGFVLICTDADSDGSHIASLLINYFDTSFPGLLQSGRIGILRTPVVRIMNTKGDIVHRFFTTAEYEKWEKENCKDGELPKGLDKPVYFKGLGKSDDFEIKDDLTTAPVVTIIYDDKAADSLNVAFDKDLTHSRKEWIAKWRDATHIQDIEFVGSGIYRKQNITDYINHELIEYTKDALFRAIPSMDDGLKRSHRQAMYAALKQFRYGRKTELMGVSRFANYAANETNYHHGEMSMCDTVVKMTQTFIGSNNLPFFQGKGQFGTRHAMGDDAASPRYLSISLPKYAPLLYDEEAIDCIPKRVIEGDEVEPMYLPAIIPMHIVNGANGIATGYSTYIPNHNYYDVINWFKERCSGTNHPNKEELLKPWYKGFTGRIDFVNAAKLDIGSNGDPLVDREIDDEDEEEMNASEGLRIASKPTGLSVRTRGKFREILMKDKRNIIVEELPIGTPIGDYRKWLDIQVKEEFIADVRDNSTTEMPKFEIKGYPVGETKTVTYKALHLDRFLSLTNITLIDSNGYPSKFEHTSQVMEIYYKKMIELYSSVKTKRMMDIRAKIEDLTFKIRFIAAVLNGTIVVFKRKKADIVKDMNAQSPPIPEKYLTSVKLHELTQEDIEAAYAEIAKLTDTFNATEKLTSEQLWLDKLIALETYLRKSKY